jgi:hypothetical protein
MPRGAKPGHPKWGGRPKGGKNKRTLALEAAARDMVAVIDETPAEFLRRVSQNESLDMNTRIAAANACAGYFSPRLAAVDLHATSENVHYVIGSEPLSADEWIKEMGQPVIEGRGTPVGVTLSAVDALRIEVLQKENQGLREQINKLQDALTLHQAREAEQRKIPLLS